MTPATRPIPLEPHDGMAVAEVRALMTAPPCILEPQASLSQALGFLQERAAHCLLVVEDARPVGCLTTRDLLRLYSQQVDPHAKCLADLMNAPVHSCLPDSPVPTALQRLQALGIGQLAVVDGEGRLCGLVAEADLQRALERSQQAEALAQDRARQRALLDAIPDLVWLKDPDGVYITCNPRFERLYGAPESEIVGRTDHDFVPHELADFFRSNDRRAMERNAPTVNEEELTFADDGHRELTQTIKTPVRDAEGRLLGVLGIGRDITELRRVEQEYRHLFARNPAPMLIYARDDLQLLTVNEAFEALYGYSAAEARALHLTDLYPPEDRAAVDRLAQQLMGLAYAGEWRHVKRDGSVANVVAQSHDILYEGREGRIAVLTDVTPLHRNREREQRRLALLESLARGASLDSLLRQLVLDYEAAFPRSLCTVLLLGEDGQHVRLGAAPSLPDFYNQAIDGAPIGPMAGSCGAAIYHGRRVIVEDIATHPNWELYRELARAAQLGSCWSEPIPGAAGQVLGSFAVYHHGPSSPSRQELNHLEFSVQLASLAITHATTTQQLRDSERRTREILQALPDLVWVKDPQGVFRDCNQRFAELLGRAPAEVIGLSGAEMLPAEVHDALTQAETSVAETGHSVTFERWLSFARSGERGLFEIVKTPLFDEAGRLQGVLGVARDITLIKQGAQAIAEQERLVDTMFSQTTDSIVLVDPATQGIVTFNDAACAGLGYTREQFSQLKPQDFQADHSTPQIGENIQRALAGESLSFETHHRRADGSLQDADMTLRQLSYAGRPLLSAVWRDVTEVKSREARIRRLNRAYAVLSGVNEAILRIHDRAPLFAEVCRIAVEEGGLRLAWIGLIDPAGEAIVPVAQAGHSDGYVESLRLSLGPPVGPTALALRQGQTMLVADIASDARSAPWREPALARGYRASAAFPIRLGDRTEGCLNVYADQPGFFDADLQRLFERLSGNLGFALAFQAAEQELLRHRQHLEELVAVRTTHLEEARRAADAASQAKTAFLANMSHEIRTPMNAIVGFAHLLRRDPLTPRQLDHLNKIADASEHLLQVINDILDFSKIEAHKVELHIAAFDLAGSLARIGDMVQGRLRHKAVQFTVTLSPDCPLQVLGDRLRLEQVLLNLAGNAVKFTEQGAVAIRVCPLPRRDERCWLRFEVVDTGIGVSAEQAARLFEAFEQADASTTRRYGGTGLGLAISRRLVELMGGRIGLDSQPGRGSTFWFELPLGLAEWPGRPPEPAPAWPGPAATAGDEAADAACLQGARLLLAEDNPINQEVARDLLEALGAQVDVADDGAEALRLAESQDYALILMDVQMPGLDGLQATAAIRRLPGRASVPILALTASAFVEDRQQALDAGMNDFLIKPVEPELLRQALIHWLRGADRRSAPGVPASEPPPVATPALAPQAVRAELERLRELLQVHDTEALDAFDAARGPLAAALGERAAELGRSIHGFDFETALARVEALLALAGTP